MTESQHKTTRYDLVAGKTQYTIRNHSYDATGRLGKSNYSQYYAGDLPTVNSLEHIYAGSRMVQNYDGSSTYGSAWHWAGASNSHGSPLNSPNPDTASQKGYNIAAMGGKNTPQRRSWQNPTTEGNKRELYGQGRPQAKDSSGNGANWYIGTLSNPASGGSNVESRFLYEGTVSATDMSRATDAREAERIGIFGTSNSFGGAYGRVTNEALGRDLNPLGRGGGQALVGGMLNVGKVAPSMPKAVLRGGRQGNSVNNLACLGCIDPDPKPPIYDPGDWGDPLPPGSRIRTKYGGHSMDNDCYQAWKNRVTQGTGCKQCIVAMCPCRLWPSAEDWIKDPVDALGKYCGCVNGYSGNGLLPCFCKFTEGGVDIICTPPAHCIKCGRPGSGGGTPPPPSDEKAPCTPGCAQDTAIFGAGTAVTGVSSWDEIQKYLVGCMGPFDWRKYCPGTGNDEFTFLEDCQACCLTVNPKAGFTIAACQNACALLAAFLAANILNPGCCDMDC